MCRMRFIADLHIHSYLSRATSKKLDLEHIHLWAQIKGLGVVGTGDFTHPRWLEEIKERLEPAEEGLYRLKAAYRQKVENEAPRSCSVEPRFMLTGEISSIYKRHGRTRKVHNILLVSSLETAERVAAILSRLGNIEADGRPILGIDSRDLLEIVLEASEEAYLIPAHIWTPWFSVLGSKSGFDDIEECFGDLSSEIFALETGLSSDPAMNWRLSALDRFRLVSNSDAHSPSKLAREANIFDTDLSFSAIREALRTGKGFLGTIEFFPEEGKYHYDGHRRCQTRMTPKETLSCRGLCPSCGRPVTVGVMHRVEQLADRPPGIKPKGSLPYTSLLSLSEVIAQCLGVGINTRAVSQRYRSILERLGPELAILTEMPLDEIEKADSAILREGIRRVRSGDVKIEAGYDGEFGKIILFTEEDRRRFSRQHTLIKAPSSIAEPGTDDAGGKRTAPRNGFECFNKPILQSMTVKENEGAAETGLNPAQKEALEHGTGPLMIVAGPGTGKTFTLTRRIAHLINLGMARPDEILAVTFTNKAAAEMKKRLEEILDRDDAMKSIYVGTFHAFSLRTLKEHAASAGLPAGFSLLNETGRLELLRELISRRGRKASQKFIIDLCNRISRAKDTLLEPELFRVSDGTFMDRDFSAMFEDYQSLLRRQRLLDYDDLVPLTVRLFKENPLILELYRKRFRWIFVDEYQDINHAQYRLIRLLAQEGSNLCVIGDPDQSIYGFRGSRPSYFLDFPRDYPGTRIIHLDQSYRFTDSILKASFQVISGNRDVPRRPISSMVSGDQKVIFCTLANERKEAEFVAEEIERMMGGTSHLSIDQGKISPEDGSEEQLGFKDFAVLYRLNVQGEVFEEAFRRAGIPFQRISDGDLRLEGEAAELMTFLKVLGNPFQDRELMKLIRSAGKGIDQQSLAALRARADQMGSSLWETLRTSEAVEGVGRQLRGPLEAFVRDLEGLILGSHNKGIIPIIEEAIEMKLLQVDPNSSFLAGIPDDGSIKDLLDSLQLNRDVDRFDQRAQKVALMTLHSSKGLEFSTVFIIGCEDGLIPYNLSPERPTSLNEERRLFYVGMTRAKTRLYLTRTESRFLYGKRVRLEPSPFLGDVEEELKEIRARKKAAEAKAGDPQLSLF